MKTVTITKGVITRAEALKISSVYVAYAERDFNAFEKMWAKFQTLKRGQKVLTYHDGQFIIAKVSSVNRNDFRAVDGPVVRVTNGEYSWRVDGDRYAWPLWDGRKT